MPHSLLSQQQDGREPRKIGVKLGANNVFPLSRDRYGTSIRCQDSIGKHPGLQLCRRRSEQAGTGILRGLN